MGKQSDKAAIRDLVLTICPTMHSVQQRKLKLLMPVLSLEVSLVKLWNHFTASSKPSYQHIENETAADEGKVGS